MKQLALFVLSVIALTLTQEINAQSCGFDHQHDHLKNTDPQYALSVQQLEQQIQQMNLAPSTRATGIVYTIPVVVHIIHLGEPIGTGTNISDAQIQSAITNLTDTYRNNFGNSEDAEIEFQLAVRDPNCNATNGIVRVNGTSVSGYSSDGIDGGAGIGANEQAIKDLSRWPTGQYMNFWIVSEIEGNDGGAGTQGYANFPSASVYNGAVMLYNAFGYDPTGALGYELKSYTNDNGTPIHEVGHYLGLYHTFQGDNGGGTCPADVTIGTDSDGCTDTPPHMRNASTCNTGSTNPCTGGLIDLVVHNFMDYSSCAYEFTPEQVTRMRTALTTQRGSLLTSPALTPPSGAFSPPVTASCTPTTGAQGLSGGYSGITEMSFANIIQTTGPANSDGGYLDFSDNCLLVAEVQTNQTYTLEIDVWTNTHEVKVWIDYNNNGVFDAAELVHDDNNVPAYGTTTASVTIPATAATNQTLRMRVLCDLNTITGPCLDPQYGQAEDYAVFITGGSATAPTAAFTASLNTVCTGGSVDFTDQSTGGPSSWEWTFNGGTPATSTNQNPTGIVYNTPGTYTVQLIVTNANGSDTLSENAYITVASGPTLNTTFTDESCNGNDGDATVAATGGSGSYTYQWDAAAGNQTTATATGLIAGTYTVTVDDGNCSQTANVTLSQQSGITANLTSNDATCNNADGDATVAPAGGNGAYTYAWSSGGTGATETNLAAGTYTVTITDGTGCTATENVIISNPNAPDIAVQSTTDANCGLNDGTATVTSTGGTGGITYSWSSGANGPTVTNLPGGTYTVTATDASGCLDTETVTIGGFPALAINLTQSTSSCGLANGTATATVSGGDGTYTYAWSSGGTTNAETGLATGQYTLTITDGTGCQKVDTFDISGTAAVAVTLNGTDASCGQNNGEIQSLVSGGDGNFTYTWSSGGTAALETGLAPGTYVLDVIDGTGCTGQQTVTIGATPAIAVTFNATDATCSLDNGVAIANVTGGLGTYTYNWSTGGQTNGEGNLYGGMYYLTITDSVGCVHQDSIFIGDTPAPVVSAAVTDATCGNANGSANAVVTGGSPNYTYAWSNGATGANASNLAGGSYDVTVTDNIGCVVTQTITVGDTPPISGSVSANQTICPGFDATLSANGGDTYQWFDSNNNPVGNGTTVLVTPPADTDYYVIISNAIGCVDTMYTTVVVELPSVTVDPDLTICSGDVTTLSAVGGPQLFWSTGESTISIDVSPTTTTTYSVLAYSGVCQGGQEDVTVYVLEDIEANASTLIADLNNGGGVSFYPTPNAPGVSYSWDFGDGNNSTLATPSHNYTTPGTYTVTLTCTINGCTWSDDIVIVADFWGVGMESYSSMIPVQVYPNPSNGLISIKGLDMTSVQDIEVFDAAGRLVAKERPTAGAFGKIQVNLTAVETGVYFIRFTDNTNTFFGRVIKH